MPACFAAPAAMFSRRRGAFRRVRRCAGSEKLRLTVKCIEVDRVAQKGGTSVHSVSLCCLSSGTTL